MVLTILGSGTSFGVPVIGCKCKVCSSDDGRDKRTRASAYIIHKSNGKTARVLVDAGPEFRIQALREKIPSLDAVLLTHGHADHLHGLDDLRIFSHTVPTHSLKFKNKKAARPEGLETYANSQTQKTVRLHFDYIFKRTQMGGGKPLIKLLDAAALTPASPLDLFGMEVISIPMKHGRLDTTGYLFVRATSDGKRRGIVYLTDCSHISGKSVELIRQSADILEHAVIDGLRKKEHSTHFNFYGALHFADKIQARHTWTTHMTHDMSHEELKKYFMEILPNFPNLEKIVRSGGSVEPAYDGLKMSC